MALLNCNDHKTYQAKRPPRPTKKNPHGCVACWCIYHTKQIDQLNARVRELEDDVRTLVWGPQC